MSEAEDRWYVNVGSDDVRMMTLDELVDAFEKGVINRETLVVEVGGNEWQPLREVADLGDEDPIPAAAPVQQAKPAPQASWPPQAVSRDSAWPPASAWPSVMPAAAASRTLSSAPLSAGPTSTIPVVQDLDFDIPPQNFKSGRKGFAVVAVVALAIAGGGAFAAVQGGMSGPMTSPVPVPAAAPVKMPDPTPTPYSKTSTTTASTETTTASTETKEADGRLSEDQKKALLTADKDRDVKKRSRATAAPRSRGGGGESTKSGAVFKATGNANDPLNPTL
jgi:hypothetical protein